MRYLTPGLLEAGRGERAPRWRPSRAASAAALGLLALSCASQGESEPAAALTAASAEVALPDINLTMIPSVGEHTFEWGPGVEPLLLAPRISWSLEFVAPANVAELWIRVRLLQADGTPCFLSAEPVGRVQRGERYFAFGDRFVMPEVEPLWRSFCSDRFDTEIVDVNLLDGPLSGVSDDAPVIRGFEFTHFYFFSRVGFRLEDAAPSPGG